MTSSLLHAAWLLPMGSPAVRDGAVVLEDGTITWVGPHTALPAAERRLPVREIDGVLTPGLVNAHAHLQYTDLVEVGRGRYHSFEHWSEAFEVAYDAVTDPGHWYHASRSGAAQAVRTGTTHAADIVTDDAARGALTDSGLGGIEYLEAIALTEHRWQIGADKSFTHWLDTSSPGAVGVSPHAPYSLDGAVIRELVAMARARGLRIHSHVGESSVEADLYATGEDAVLTIYGGIRTEFELVRRGGLGCSTGEYAERVGLLGPDTHIAHAVYLDAFDRALVRDTGTAVVLCPRSNAVIGLAEAPVADYLREGHVIAVGTDSLASVPSMDLLADVALLAEIARRQGYRGDDLDRRLLEAATLGGAAALGLTGTGVLAPGAPASVAAFAVDPGEDEPYCSLVREGAGTCVLTLVDGIVRHHVSAVRS